MPGPPVPVGYAFVLNTIGILLKPKLIMVSLVVDVWHPTQLETNSCFSGPESVPPVRTPPSHPAFLSQP